MDEWEQSASEGSDPRAARMHVFIAFIPNPEHTMMNVDAAQHSSGVTGQPCWLFSDLFHFGLAGLIFALILPS